MAGLKIPDSKVRDLIAKGKAVGQGGMFVQGQLPMVYRRGLLPPVLLWFPTAVNPSVSSDVYQVP